MRTSLLSFWWHVGASEVCVGHFVELERFFGW